MITGDRLRALREQKNFSQGEIEKRTGLLRCYISRVEHGTRFPLSRRLKSLLAPLKSPCINSFMMGKNRPSYGIFRSANLLTTLRGVVPVETHAGWPSFAAFLVEQKKVTGSY
jgi:transcriptional regulator with XRE-family HTH domain